jgi:hypothetical protein
MPLRSIIAGAALFLLASLSIAQYRNQDPAGDPEQYFRSPARLGLNNLHGLLDPSRMHMSHSLSMGYFSGSGISASRGLYMNRIDYQISRPLSVTTHLGYQFQPSGPAELNPALNGNQFVGGADLNWRPTSNSVFRLSVSRGLYPESYYGPYGYGWNTYGYRSIFDRP